jgi:hypothetical protein
MAASRSSNTWNRHNAALRCYYKFCSSENVPITWPISIENFRKYVNWSLTVKKLSPSTVKQYISDLKIAHNLRNLEPEFFSDFFTKSMLKGAENISLYSNVKKQPKLVMTIPLLKLIGHEIASSSWNTDSKKVFWAACCLAFFGSFRMGEILPYSDSAYSRETLTWNRVNFSDKEYATIQINFPKINPKGKGDFVDIFKTNDVNLCAYSCLKSLSVAKPLHVQRNLPVFTFNSGLYLSQKTFNLTIRNLLFKHLGVTALSFSGHSFRAGIPSAIANHPSLLSNDDVCKWGRWSSDCFTTYTRLKISARREIFKKIMSAVGLDK